jgi:nanoRNase/pAp phosphatase (c-di-AMP/oligoRNAs hydrolase)
MVVALAAAYRCGLKIICPLGRSAVITRGKNKLNASNAAGCRSTCSFMLNCIIFKFATQRNSPARTSGPAVHSVLSGGMQVLVPDVRRPGIRKDVMVTDITVYAEQQAGRVEEFRRRMTPSTSTLILTHDYPDPDCLASACGLAHLLAFWGTASTVISFGGFIGRAENRAMIRFLNIHTIPYMLLELKDYDRIVLVDCFPGRSNVSLPVDKAVNAVIDHHIPDQLASLPFYHDVRKNIGASSTIVIEYLRTANCPLTPKLATALFYGIKTDTGDMGRDSSPEDLESYKYLFGQMDHGLLAKIENPDRDVAFFRMVHRAAQSMVAFGSLGYIPLGPVVSPDYIAEMADLFHSLEKIDITVCCGIFKKNIFFSIRAKNRDEAGMNAEKVASALGGGGGGHGKVGAGRVPLQKGREEELISGFVATIKAMFNIGNVEGVHILTDDKKK